MSGAQDWIKEVEMNCAALTRNHSSCRNRAMRGAKYCYVHSFGKIRGVPWYKNSTVHFVIGILLALYFGVTGATRERQGEILKKVDQIPRRTVEELKGIGLDENKIAVVLRYAYEFDSYLGAENAFGNEDRRIDSGQPLRKRYNAEEPVRLVFGVANNNEGIPFEDVVLQTVFLDEGIEVVSAEGWQVQRVNQCYSYFFPRINNTPLNAIGAIAARFPRPGTYRMLCAVDGRGVRPIEVPFHVILY